MRVVHVIASGRVQGVGYRAWCAGEARARGLRGFVRNRRDGTVEAVFGGDGQTVEAMLAACRTGPAAARVDGLVIREEEAAALPGAAGFAVRETA